jgi:hypothetical protein
MFFPSFFVNHNIVKEGKQTIADKILKNLDYEALKSLWGIAKSKRHHQKLIMSFMCVEGSIMNVYLHIDLVIPRERV